MTAAPTRYSSQSMGAVRQSVRVEILGDVPRARAEDIAQLDELQQRLVRFLLQKQASIFEKGFAGHAHITAEDCAKEMSVPSERVRSAITNIVIVHRDEPLAASRLLSGGCRLSRGTVSDERVKTLILSELWSDPRVSDTGLDSKLRKSHQVELSPADVRRFRAALLLSAEATTDVGDALRAFAPCTWLREPFEARISARTNRPTPVAPLPSPNLRAPKGPLAVGPGHLPPAGYRHIDRPLFVHQQQAVAALDQWYADAAATRGILCLPTGGGKTKTAVTFVLSKVIERGARCLWLAHRDELIDQAYATFVESSHLAPRAFTLGKWTSAHKQLGRPDITVASIPTLAFQDDKGLAAFSSVQGNFDFCVVDECHHGAARTWRRLIDALRERSPGLRVLGLSATPTRTDEKEVGSLIRQFGDVQFEIGTLPLIKQGILARPTIIAMNTGRTFDATAAERDAFEQFHDLPTRLVNRIADDPVRNEVIARAYLAQRSAWGQTLIFAATTDQSKRLAALLRSERVRVGEVYGESTANARARVVEGFRKGEVEVVVNCGVFAEGTDLPSVRTVVLARPTRSRIIFAQMVGRGMRGPVLGGTAECNVVSFFDEVIGLMHTHLATGFSDVMEANQALGLSTDASERTDTVDEDPGPVVPGVGEEAAVRSLFQAHNLGPVDGCDLPLLGWFDAQRGAQRRYLPCFTDEERGAVEAWVAARPDVLAPTLPNVPTVAVEEFVAFAAPTECSIRWRAIDAEIGPSELNEIASELAGTADSPPPSLTAAVLAEEPTNNYPADVDPDWWLYAQECLAVPSGTVLLRGGMRVKHGSLLAAEGLWTLFGGVIPTEDAESVLSLAGTRAARQGGDPQEAKEIMQSAINSGALPIARERPQAPDHKTLIAFLDLKPKSEWLQILEVLRITGMFVQAVDSSRGLLIELLRYVTSSGGER